MKRKPLILFILFLISISANSQFEFNKFDLPKGELEGWQRDKTSNPNATDKMPVYAGIGEYLLRIEPTKDYLTQLFDKEYNLVWETHTPQMKGGFGINFINHARFIASDNSFIYQIDYGLNNGSGIIKVIDIKSGENKAKEFKINKNELVQYIGEGENPIFSSKGMHLLLSDNKNATYLTTIDPDGNITTTALSITGNKYYNERSMYSDGNWYFTGLMDGKKYDIHKYYYDYKSKKITFESSALSLSGAVSSINSNDIDAGSETVLDIKANSWIDEKGKIKNILAYISYDSKKSGYSSALSAANINLFLYEDGKEKKSQSYSLEKYLSNYVPNNIQIINTLFNLVFLPSSGSDHLLGIEMKTGFGKFMTLIFHVDENLNITPTQAFNENELINMAFTSFKKYAKGYVEPGSIGSVYDNAQYYYYEKIVNDINKNAPSGEKCKYTGISLNGKHIIIRDNIETSDSEVFELKQ